MVTMGHRFDRVAGHHNVDFSSGLSFNWWNADLAVGMALHGSPAGTNQAGLIQLPIICLNRFP